MKKIFFLFLFVFLVDSNFPAWADTVFVKPQGDYAKIDVDVSNSVTEILMDETKNSHVKEKAALQIQKDPGSFTPMALLALGCYNISGNNLSKGAFWCRAAIFRATVDLKIYPDPSLTDVIPVMFSTMKTCAQKHINTPEKFAIWEKELRNVSKVLVTWDKKTPRHYDDRWACLHSARAFYDTHIQSVSRKEKDKIIAEEYRLFDIATKDENP